MELQFSGINAHRLIGHVERYQRRLRRVFNKIQESDPQLEDNSTLIIAIRSIHDTMGTNGIVQALLVFGTVPYFPALSGAQSTHEERFSPQRQARHYWRL